jgi:hypothetical protein
MASALSNPSLKTSEHNTHAKRAMSASIRLDRIVTDSLVTPIAKSAASIIALPLDTNWSATKRRQSLLSSAPNAELFRATVFLSCTSALTSKRTRSRRLALPCTCTTALSAITTPTSVADDDALATPPAKEHGLKTAMNAITASTLPRAVTLATTEFCTVSAAQLAATARAWPSTTP